MAIPLAYNVGSVRTRWPSAVVAVLGIAGTVAVFVAMLAMERGFRGTLVSSGSPENAMVRRGGASAEMESILTVGDVRIIDGAPGIARADDAPLVVPEVVVVASFPLKDGGSDALVQVRGTTERVLKVRERVRLTAGRLFHAGLFELVVGKHAAHNYAGFGLGDTVRFGGGTWTVVGIFDAGGSAFDSEVWCDADVLNQTYQRPRGIFQSATVRLSARGELERLKSALAADPRLSVQVEREADYYARQSHAVSTMILVLGSLVAAVMGIGAVFGALNTMYSAVAERAREIAILRALGFGEGSVVLSFVLESLLVALVGGVLGCLAVLPMNGLVTGTMNWQTMSHTAFAFRVTPDLLATGLVFALAMGLVGGLPPAIRAARLTVASALRAL